MEYFTTDHLIFVLFAAVLAATVYTFFMQRSLSELAKRLLERKACDENTALTLEQLGYKNGVSSALAAFFAVNGNSIANAVVKIKPEEENTKSELLFEEKAKIRYYIPEEKNDERLEKHIKDKLSFSKLVIIIALLVAIALAASTVIDLLKSYAGSLTEDGGNNVYGTEREETSLLEEQEEANRKEEQQKKEEEELEKIKEQSEKELEEALDAQADGDGESSDTDDAVMPEAEAEEFAE